MATLWSYSLFFSTGSIFSYFPVKGDVSVYSFSTPKLIVLGRSRLSWHPV